MRVATTLLACMWMLGAPQAAAAKAANDLRFVGLHPHGPLARVAAGEVATPEPGACRTWGKRGASWHTLDRFGRVVGQARIRALDRYDVTHCDELAFEHDTGKPGVGLFVSRAYRPLAIDAWTPAKQAKRTLTQITRKRDQPLAKPHDISPSQLPPGVHRLFFRTPDGVRRVAVGGKALTVYRFERGAWSREHELPPNGDGNFSETFLIAGVLDMNGDGAPELVVHWAGIDGYQDLTLSLGRGSSRWRTISPGIHGAYASVRTTHDPRWATTGEAPPRVPTLRVATIAGPKP